MIKKRANTAALVRIAALAALCLPWSRARAQALYSVLPEEPPSSLFSTKLGDSEVEAFAQGFWEASILSAGAWSIDSGGSSFGANPPFQFMQTPDLYVFLSLRRTWFFEAYVTNEAADNRFTLAFEGDDGDFIKFARLGNSGISMPSYPFMSFGSPDGSFGAAMSASDAASGVSLDAMVRWDGLRWETRDFFGSSEMIETELAPGDDLRGRRFVLPSGGLVSVELYEARTSGPRRLASDEYSASLASGVILLAAEPSGELTAAYVDSLGARASVTLYAFAEDDDGDPVRRYNHYEARNLYALPDTASARQLFVRDLATGTVDTRFEVGRVGPGLVQVLRSGSGPDPDDDGYMRPFVDLTPWSYDRSNGGGDATVASEGFAIVARSSETVEAIMLGDGAVAGTISVYRDGVASSSFGYDEAGRTLTLSPPPRAGESIRVRYAVSTTDGADGALAFGVGARFPWLGQSWSTAIGGRWPLFGLGYETGDSMQPAWLGISAGVTGRAGVVDGIAATGAAVPVAYTLEAMARYLRAGSRGLYRVVGMEDYGDSLWLEPFRQVSPEDGGITASVVVDAELAASDAFGDLLDDLRSGGGPTNRALEIVAGEAGSSSDARFVRYVDPVPLSSYERLSFFVKATGTGLGSVLTLRVGNGKGTGAVVSLPLGPIAGDGWRKVTMGLDPLAALAIVSGDGESLVIAGASASYAAPDTAGLVELELSGLAAGTGAAVMIDELALEGARDGFSALAAASLSFGDRTEKRGAYLLAEASGELADAAVVASRLEAGLNAPFAELSLSASPAYASGQASAGLGYAVALPGRRSPWRVVDEYSVDEALGLYARELQAAARSGLFTASAVAGSSQEPNAFDQAWKASVGVAGVATATMAASLASSEAVVSGLGFGEAWLDSWSLLLPASEADADSRRLELAADAAGSRLTLSAYRDYERGSVPASSVVAKASLPTRFGPVSIAPYYSRKASVERASESGSFAGDVADFYRAVVAAGTLWSSVPIVELWSADAFDGFEAFADGASAASHEAELGVALRRPIGYGLVDLLAPSSATLSYARLIELDADTAVESGRLSLSIAGGAANVFASSGAAPLLKRAAFDEYSFKHALSLTRYASDGAVLPSLTSSLAMSLEGTGGLGFALTSNLAIETTRSLIPWSESIDAALTTRPTRTWLGDLAGLAIDARRRSARASADSGADEEPSWVSEWLDATLSEPLALKDGYTAGLTVGRTKSASAPLSERLSLGYSTRATAGGSLSIGLGVGLWQTLAAYVDGALWGFGYSLSLEAKVVF